MRIDNGTKKKKKNEDTRNRCVVSSIFVLASFHRSFLRVVILRTRDTVSNISSTRNVSRANVSRAFLISETKIVSRIFRRPLGSFSIRSVEHRARNESKKFYNDENTRKSRRLQASFAFRVFGVLLVSAQRSPIRRPMYATVVAHARPTCPRMRIRRDNRSRGSE